MKRDSLLNRILHCIALLLVIYVSYGLYRTYQESDIVRIDYVGTNPTEYTFHAPIDSVKKCILYIGHFGKFKGLRIMDYDGDSLIMRDIGPSKSSYIYTYRSKNKRKYGSNPRQHYEFRIDLVPVSQGETKVEINTIHHSIVSGVKWWLNLTFNDRYIAKSKDVESSTIEEYELLRYIGKLLGCIDSMPYVKYPSCWSKHEILLFFGDENPFSLKEMFNDETDTMAIMYFYAFGQRQGEKFITEKIRESLMCIHEKDRIEYIEDIRTVFRAKDMEDARFVFDTFKSKWRKLYPKAFKVFDSYVEDQFCRYSKYSLPIRRVIYDSDPQMKKDSLTTGIQFLDTY